MSAYVEWKYPRTKAGLFGPSDAGADLKVKPMTWRLFPASGEPRGPTAFAAIRDLGDSGDSTPGGTSGGGGGGIMATSAPPGSLQDKVHNKRPDAPRQPVFLTDEAAISSWLDPAATLDDLRSHLCPVPDGWLDKESMRAAQAS